MAHLAEGESDTSLECSLGISVCVLESGQDQVADLFGAQVLERVAKGGDSGVLDLGLVVIEQKGESLDEIVVTNFLAKSLSEQSEFLGETQANLPGLILTGSQKGAEGVNLVFFLAKVGGHVDEALEAEHANGVLFVLG